MAKIWSFWLRNSFGNRMEQPIPFHDAAEALQFLDQSLKNGYGLAAMSINDDATAKQIEFTEQVKSGEVDLLKGFRG